MTLNGIRNAAAQPLFDGDATSAIADRSKARAAAAAGLNLVSIGLVGAATIILFAVPSVSLLDTGTALLTRPFTGVSISNDTDRDIPVVRAQTYSPTPDAAKNLPTPPPKDASTFETPEVARAKPSFELPLPNRDASTTTAAVGDAVLMRDVPITNPRSIEVNGAEAASAEGRPIADEVSTIPDVSRRSVPTEIPDEGRGEVSRTVEIQQDQPANPDPDNRPTEKAPARKEQSQPFHRHLLGSNAAFRSRVQKECGPIIFPALRRHCIASFGIHYR